jgi:molybdenum cofactor biosynthesis enzyme MoaA
MQGLVANLSPVIWIGGSEPLLHAGIGHFVRAIAQSGHFVFLETDGTLLRRCIHEFQPLPRLFLTVRLNLPQAPEFTLAVEGLRAAGLSGFFTVIHSLVQEGTALAQLTVLRTFIAENDVDGWLITAGSTDQAIVRKAAEARAVIRSSFWRQFSQHVEGSLLVRAQGGELHKTSASVGETETHQEGVGVA